MRTQATGPGRKGTITEDGVGKLICSQATGEEARKLKVLFDEICNGNLGFWTPIMWAAQEQRLTKTDEKCLERIVKRVEADFMEFVTDGGGG